MLSTALTATRRIAQRQSVASSWGLLAGSRVAHKVGEPVVMWPPLPPPEFEADGSPRKYPLNQALYVHGHNYERWSLNPVGAFHTVYIGEFGK